MCSEESQSPTLGESVFNSPRVDEEGEGEWRGTADVNPEESAQMPWLQAVRYGRLYMSKSYQEFFVIIINNVIKIMAIFLDKFRNRHILLLFITTEVSVSLC